MLDANEFKKITVTRNGRNIRGDEGFVVYSAVNKVNGKRYVGITQTDVRRRITAHLCEGRYPFGRALRKYGWDGFIIEIIDCALTREELGEKEKFWIAYFDCMQPKGYNLTTGGDRAYTTTVETGRRISAAKIGKKRPDQVPEDLTGQRFGRLRVLSLHSRNPARWLCECDCGNEHDVVAVLLKNGKAKSCGCLRREKSGARQLKHGFAGNGHKHINPNRVYSVWRAMWHRCTNENNERFGDFGGRGIRVCDRWQDFSEFLSDMGEGAVGLRLIRLDKDGDYTPENCKWGTAHEQCSNRRPRKDKGVTRGPHGKSAAI